MYHCGNEINETESKDGSIDIDDGIDFDFDNADKEKADGNEWGHEDKLFDVDLPLPCLLEVENTEKSFSGLLNKYLHTIVN